MSKAEQIYYSYPISKLELPVRVYNALTKMGYTTVGQVAQMTIAELLDLQHVGMTSIGHVLQGMAALSLAERVAVLERLMEDLRGHPALA
jgi:DNA-directed RNA polymerase alpha subunit